MATKKENTGYTCRVCGETFNTLSECVRHEQQCIERIEKEERETRRKKEQEERKAKVENLTEELKKVEAATAEAYKVYNELLQKKNKIKSEINKLNSFTYERTYNSLDDFNKNFLNDLLNWF